jgi:uncharacterized membrane protein SpoIIM required for sporulation
MTYWLILIFIALILSSIARYICKKYFPELLQEARDQYYEEHYPHGYPLLKLGKKVNNFKVKYLAKQNFKPVRLFNRRIMNPNKKVKHEIL